MLAAYRRASREDRPGPADGLAIDPALYPLNYSVPMEKMMDVPPIKGEKLTTWRVLSGGTQICLDFVAADGRTHRIVLPFDTLSALMMTLPRMLQSALDQRFPDGSLRVVQALGNWRLEQQAGGAGLILKLGTTDGFEVAFALNHEHAASLGAALLQTPHEAEASLVRTLN